MRKLLEKARGWTPEWQKEIEEAASRDIELAVESAEELAPPEPSLLGWLQYRL